jgi:cytochrome c biogenesis protein CcmG/thiol:disulfide interchange protein DsbE
VAMLALGGVAAVALGFSVVPGIWSSGHAGGHAHGSPRAVEAFTVSDLDGRPIASADWRGTVTVVNFWATWCAPCRVEIPEFVALQDKYRGHVRFIGFSADEGPVDEVRGFARELGINYPVAVVDAAIEETFGGVVGLPTTFVLDRDGQIVHTYVGLVDPLDLEREIRELADLPGSG